MTLNEEITKLRTTASYIGGNHLTNKEAEEKINEIADNLVKIQEKLSLATDKMKEEINYSLLGVDERYLYLIKKQRSFDELNNIGGKMSDLTTGGILFGYQSPISQIYKDVEYKFKEDMENKTMEAVHHFGISVDKEELIKALQYDRNQYDKGFADGRASVVEELEKIKDKIEWESNGQTDAFIKAYKVLDIIDNHIAELKGENNE